MLNYMTIRIKNVTCFAINKEIMVQMSYKMIKSWELYDKLNKNELLFLQNVI